MRTNNHFPSILDLPKSRIACHFAHLLPFHLKHVVKVNDSDDEVKASGTGAHHTHTRHKTIPNTRLGQGEARPSDLHNVSVVKRLWKFAVEEPIAFPLCPIQLMVGFPVPHLGRSRPLDSQAKVDIRSGRLGPAIWVQGMMRKGTLAISRSRRESRSTR